MVVKIVLVALFLAIYLKALHVASVFRRDHHNQSTTPRRQMELLQVKVTVTEIFNYNQGSWGARGINH